MLTEAEVKQAENIVYAILKRENILQGKTGQLVLEIESDINIEECDEEYMQDKSVACWWFSNDDGKSQNIRHDQLFIFGNGKFTGKSTKVLKPLPFTFEEANKVWELNSQGVGLSSILTENFHYSPSMSDIQFIIWAMKNGKCDWMLKGTRADRYDFDFKKWIGKKK